MITDIEQRYFSEFVKLRDIIVSDYRDLDSASMTLEQWRFLEDRTTTLLDELDSLNSTQIRKVASDAEALGTRNLIIDSVIVFICLSLLELAITGNKLC